ncbi:hypothetical protein AMECASPLE_004301 [Ameca splendens]|uniref:Dirigent protein n=1 Tax=Ameca splendens TaxID=208324 RepID=A0ABV0ZIL9_9TELE
MFPCFNTTKLAGAGAGSCGVNANTRRSRHYLFFHDYAQANNWTIGIINANRAGPTFYEVQLESYERGPSLQESPLISLLYYL